MKNNERINQIIATFSGQGNIITFPKIYLEITQDVNAAIVLNQIVFWSDRTKRKDGYFYKSYKDWKSEILLSQFQIKRAVDKLTELGVVSTKLHRAHGAPTIHYRADIGLLRNLIIKKFDNQETKQSDYQETSLSDYEETKQSDYQETKQSLTDDYTVEQHTDEYTDNKPSKADALNDEFDKWWDLYGKRGNRKPALQKFKSCRKKHSFDQIINGTKEYLKTVTDKKFQKHGSTFLNAEGYMDDYKQDANYNIGASNEVASMEEELGLKTEPTREFTQEEIEEYNREELSF